MDYADGSGVDPTSSTQFLSTRVQNVPVATGQRVHIVASQSFGTTSAVGATNLDLYVCYRVQGSTGTPYTLGAGVWQLTAVQGERKLFTLSAVVGLVGGTYEFGMCGDDDGNGNWNWNEWGYVSVIVAEY
jgi:hypothetical protein